MAAAHILYVGQHHHLLDQTVLTGIGGSYMCSASRTVSSAYTVMHVTELPHRRTLFQVSGLPAAFRHIGQIGGFSADEKRHLKLCIPLTTLSPPITIIASVCLVVRKNWLFKTGKAFRRTRCMRVGNTCLLYFLITPLAVRSAAEHGSFST